MPIDKATALAHIDDVFKRRKELKNWTTEDVAEMVMLECAAIKRLAPPGSAYLDQMEKAFPEWTRGTQASRVEAAERHLEGILRGLRADWEAERLQSFEELIHADLFSDFLEMAEYFLEEGYKDPAAVMAGGVLEEHLRKLCGKHGVALPTRPKLDGMNSDLAKVGAYSKNEQKQVTAWAGIRNDGAHGNYGNYRPDEVRLMIAGIRDFICRNPA
jgi:hypothetical protein